MIGTAVTLLAGATGLVVGSYVTTAAVRAARGEPSTTGRSHCDACGRSLNFLRTIPVLGFIVLRGACLDCGEPIDPVHLIGEAAGGLTLALAFALLPVVDAALVGAIGFLLLAAAVFDAKTRRLPDILVGPVAALGAVAAGRHGLQAVGIGVGAVVVAAALLCGVRAVSAGRGRDPGLGLGDVKLICALSLWLGVATSWMVVLAAAAGLVWVLISRPADGRIAFGPMIAAAGWGVGLMLEAGGWRAIT